MSTALKSTTADFSAGAGHSQLPFVAPASLAMGYDFSRQNWKAGIVPGQTATTSVLDFGNGTSAPGDAGWTRSINGRGVRFLSTGYASLGDTFPQLNTGDGVGMTFMLLGGSEAIPGAGSAYQPMLVLGAVLGLGETTYANPAQFVGAAVNSSYDMNKAQAYEARKPDQANLVILRCNGDNTWSLFVPNTGYRLDFTNADVGITSPFSPAGGGGVGGSSGIGRGNPTTTLWAHTFNMYLTARWSRKLTDDEVAAQYQRAKLRFPGILN